MIMIIIYFVYRESYSKKEQYPSRKSRVISDLPTILRIP